ncbi:MAG TPA: hypothetical protein VK053_05935 [Jiangellaceae bacterium]|nr:hypothetical protein [Jiangellaceae bacterium]
MDDRSRSRDRQAWQAQRREALAVQDAALQRAKAAESSRAAEMLREFVTAMYDAGARPHPLRARARGRSRYRTGITGWYLRANRSLGVGTDGAFYVLDVPTSLTSAVLGVRVEPSPPSLQVGKGARDGESISLERLLAIRLEQETPHRA